MENLRKNKLKNKSKIQENFELKWGIAANSKAQGEQRQADRVSSATYFYNPDSRDSTPSEIIA